MKRFSPRMLAAAIGFSVAFSVPVLAQETFSYPEDFPPRTLQALGYFSGSLAPSGSDTGKSASVSGNRVTLNKGTIGSVFGAINSNDSDAVTGNQVMINGGTVNGGAYGGSGRPAVVVGNSITINNGTINGSIIGGDSGGADALATNNSVTINGGTVNGNIYGGYGTGNDASATNNSVTISGGTVNGEIFGGMALRGFGASFPKSNTVTIRGAPTLRNATLWGGGSQKLMSSEGGDCQGSVDNTLNLYSIGLTVYYVECFQNLNFYLPATLKTGGTMLTTDTVGLPPTIGVNLDGAGPPLQTGNRFILIKAGMLTSGLFQPTSGTVGGYAYTVQKEGNNLVLVIGEKLPDPTRRYDGQWIKVDDAGNNDEDAWGLSILMGFPNNSRYIFVPWFTYDENGKAAWYIFQGDNWSADDRITAEVRRYKGPNWGTSWNNSQVSFEVAGTATLTFTSATTATFSYNVDGASRTINIAPIDNVPLLANAYTGQWASASEDAWGLSVLRGFQSNPDYVFVPWFTYDKDGKAAWYIFQNNIDGNTVSADVYRYTGSKWGATLYDNHAIANEKVGTA
ncbi:MAG: carbohydrate-binding domain-containing protein, partial [Burkholderiales bacterium]|nr:carbohydrate-binding domain-containing protein [Burkholderiales bacterium]